ncbi:hypothetical protein [Undibacterium sp. TS12]|uniref:hypothetical protein n=1 Tax=Undibacterium sp. TS12 TaxID=2908202 RepID=UPI001F4CEA88|nr:hypothetical protein [Undibacterium sp. TS12]MCH8618142.1 hypothetical protein [Undibacterium sp. TS12]
MDIQFDSDFAQRVLDAVRSLGRGKKLRSDTLKTRLCHKTGLLPIEVDEGIRELHRHGLLMFQANARGQPISGYVEFVPKEKVISDEETCWSDALKMQGFNEVMVALLMPLASRLTGMTTGDVQILAKCLATLKGSDKFHELSDVGPNVSARMVMGSAKVISRIPPKAMALLGLHSHLHSPSPRYLLHAGPAANVESTSTLLIENPQAFENAVASGLADRMSLVCTFGFALSYVGQVWPGSLEDKQQGELHVLQRCGSKRSIAELFGAPQVYFWGDLDIGALKIFLACRSAIPTLQLSAIYKAMEGHLLDPMQSHPYAEIYDKEGQARMFAFLDQTIEVEPAVHALFKQCARRGVDQEIVSVADIALLGGMRY